MPGPFNKKPIGETILAIAIMASMLVILAICGLADNLSPKHDGRVRSVADEAGIMFSGIPGNSMQGEPASR